MAVMEAMAAGLPVVATAVGGVPELVEHGVTGLLAPRGDTRRIGGCARARWRAIPALRGRLGRAPRRARTALRRGSHGGGVCRTVRAARGGAGMTGRVLLLTTSLARGGAETQVAQLAAELRRRGWEVTSFRLLPTGPGGRTPKSSVRSGCTRLACRVLRAAMLPPAPGAARAPVPRQRGGRG